MNLELSEEDAADIGNEVHYYGNTDKSKVQVLLRDRAALVAENERLTIDGANARNLLYDIFPIIDAMLPVTPRPMLPASHDLYQTDMDARKRQRWLHDARKMLPAIAALAATGTPGETGEKSC